MSDWFEFFKIPIARDIFATLATLRASKIFFNVRKYNNQLPTKEGICLNLKEVKFLNNIQENGKFQYGNFNVVMDSTMKLSKDAKTIFIEKENLLPILVKIISMMESYEKFNLNEMIIGIYKAMKTENSKNLTFEVINFLMDYGWVFQIPNKIRQEWEEFIFENKLYEESKIDKKNRYYEFIFTILHSSFPE